MNINTNKLSCPVCSKQQSVPLLYLEDFPIYQHPMDDVSGVKPPFSLSLHYFICKSCGHAFQDEVDQSTLEQIYEQHYYTPAPEGVGATFRNDFKYFIDRNNLLNGLRHSTSSRLTAFEIGCSTGEVMQDIAAFANIAEVVGVEPNLETAQVAQAIGYEVSVDFFSEDFAQNLDRTFDFIYSRHVIEHIFDFQGFFKGIKHISHEQSCLVLETPSLDWGIENSSTVAFHFEHIHVFSERSLASLAQTYGWQLQSKTVTESGNLIIAFTQSKANRELAPMPELFEQFQQKSYHFVPDLKAACKDKKVIFWGAGSAAITLMSAANISPDYLLDGNPNKQGKRFVGQELIVGYAPDTIRQIIENGADNEYVIVISSSFHKEISQVIKQLGWRGTCYSPYDI